MKVDLDLSNYVTKANLKRARSRNRFSQFENLGRKPDGDKPKSVPADLIGLSDVVNTDISKPNLCPKLVTKINTINNKIPSDR